MRIEKLNVFTPTYPISKLREIRMSWVIDADEDETKISDEESENKLQFQDWHQKIFRCYCEYSRHLPVEERRTKKLPEKHVVSTRKFRKKKRHWHVWLVCLPGGDWRLSGKVAIDYGALYGGGTPPPLYYSIFLFDFNGAYFCTTLPWRRYLQLCKEGRHWVTCRRFYCIRVK